MHLFSKNSVQLSKQWLPEHGHFVLQLVEIQVSEDFIYDKNLKRKLLKCRQMYADTLALGDRRTCRALNDVSNAAYRKPMFRAG